MKADRSRPTRGVRTDSPRARRNPTDKFSCPTCGAWQSRVVDSRPDTEGLSYIRWRHCIACHQLFETAEVPIPSNGQGFTPGVKYIAPARQTAFRLSPQQRADLASALEPHVLTGTLLQAIEDQLYVYWETTALKRAMPKHIAAWQKQLLRAERLARELREVLPMAHRAVEEALLQLKDISGERATAARDAEATDDRNDDAALSSLLERRALVWKQIADRLPRPQRHRERNHAVIWLGLFVVEQLAAQTPPIPLKLGRKTVVVEVLGLVRRWATMRAGLPDNKSSSSDYEFSCDMVETYNNGALTASSNPFTSFIEEAQHRSLLARSQNSG